MKQLEFSVNFLVNHKLYFYLAIAAFSAVFAFANTVHNPYRRQNKMFRKGCKALSQVGVGKSASRAIGVLDDTYSRQWRAYLRSDAAKPSLTFEFVPQKHKTVFKLSAIAAWLVSASYLAVFALDGADVEYLLLQLAVGSFFAFVFLLKGILGRVRDKGAGRLFARYVTRLNNCRSLPCGAPVSDVSVGQAEEQIRIAKRTNGAEAVNKAAEALRSKGLNGTRTVEQQRKLNEALNGLLQEFARNKTTTEG